MPDHPPSVPWGFPVRFVTDQPVVFLAVVVFPIVTVVTVVALIVRGTRTRR